MWLFPRCKSVIHSPPAFFFLFFLKSSGAQLAHTISFLYARIGPQWLSELRRLLPNVPRQVACELLSGSFRIGSHTMPGQRHSQPTPTSLGQGSMRVLGVTCHLHFWQNDRGLLHATAVTRGRNGHPSKSPHTKLILDKKILLPLQPGYELAAFRSRVRRSYQQAIPAP